MTRLARRLVVVTIVGLVCVAPAAAAWSPAAAGRGTSWGSGALGTSDNLTSTRVIEIAKTAPRVQAWLRDHPATVRLPSREAIPNTWTVSFADARLKVQAQVVVDDATGKITEERTGPQVAWQMARGYPGAFGRSITKPAIWIPLFVLFLVPFIRWRRLLSWHTLDLLALCAFAISLIWFNRGEIFTSVPLAVPPLVYIAVRLAVVGLRSPPAQKAGAALHTSHGPRLVSWCPTWLLGALLFLALGLRLGLNAFDSNVVDVGYAGVVGADRIAGGQSPYGTIPDATCRRCDTYGPLMYLLYVPFEAIMPWSGRWDDLPAAHGVATMFDLVTLAGLLLLGWRIGGQRLAAGFGLAWTAFPFTAYTLESNANDSLIAACMVWGLVLAHRPFARGLMLGIAVFAKFTPAILIPLWARHPFPRAQTKRRWPRYAVGLAFVGVASGWVLLLDGSTSLSRFWDRSIGFQLGRDSPFSLWGQYEWLNPVRITLVVVIAVAAIAFAVRPRGLDLRRLAALSGALLAGVQLTMTHWFYLYIPWFLPFAIVALLPVWPPTTTEEPPPEPEQPSHATPVEALA